MEPTRLPLLEDQSRGVLAAVTVVSDSSDYKQSARTLTHVVLIPSMRGGRSGQ